MQHQQPQSAQQKTPDAKIKQASLARLIILQVAADKPTRPGQQGITNQAVEESGFIRKVKPVKHRQVQQRPGHPGTYKIQAKPDEDKR